MATIEYVDGEKTITVRMSTNYLARLNHLLLTSGWFTDERHMVDVCAAIGRGEVPKDDPSMNTETILSLIVLITEAARKEGLVHKVEVDEGGNVKKG
jgi:hypothetical protein